MADFGIRFFLCNILICAVTCMLLLAKRVLKSHLTSRMQFNLWFLLSGLLAVPFSPVRPVPFSQIFLWLDKLKNAASPDAESIAETIKKVNASGAAGQINDFALSVSNKTPSMIGLILSWIWLAGIFAMLLKTAKSGSRLSAMKKSALPLQNREIRMLYDSCLSELKIKRKIPIYSTVFLKSPVIVGLFRPCIYLPLHMISDFNRDIYKYEYGAALHVSVGHACPRGHRDIHGRCFSAADMRYILLHELQHYKHRDAISGCLMNLTGILYWFNPFVLYALREMRDDREVACDASVLKLLNESDYEAYGNTLIRFAERVSLTPFPFAAGISGTMRQMQKRILNISSYKKPSVREKIKGAGIFALIAVMLFGLTPMLSTCAADQNYYKWDISPEKVHSIDLSAYFNGYDGSFVLYDLNNSAWSIYDMERATLRIPPDSTYKIYDALFGLEEGVITPDSFMAWDGTDYPFEAWNADQNLLSAIQSSVNWYFGEIDRQLGVAAIQSYIRKIGYGNENVKNGKQCPIDIDSYWMQGTLKISPVEQVELLTALHSNRFDFAPENINAVKASIRLFSSETGTLYGKTGTGRVDGRDVNGWFAGYIETADNTYFFAANIQSAETANGSKASEITLSILSSMGIWKQ